MSKIAEIADEINKISNQLATLAESIIREEKTRWEQCAQCNEFYPYEDMHWDEERNEWKCDPCYSGVPVIW